MRRTRATLLPFMAAGLAWTGCGGVHHEPKTSAPDSHASADPANHPHSAESPEIASSSADDSAVSVRSSGEPRSSPAGGAIQRSAPGETAPSLRAVDAASAPSDDRGAPALTTASTEIPIVEEPIYLPGARARPKGSAVEASLDDEIVATWNRGGLTAEPALGPKGKPAHTAPRVKVDVTEVRGDASEADVQRVARLKSYWPFRICYEQGLRRTQKLHGTIKLRLTIGPSGRPSGVEQLATELGDAAVVGCVVKSAMGLGLPAPTNGAPQVTLDISLWPGDEPVSAPPALRGKYALPARANDITEQLRARLPAVRNCYASGLVRHERLWGRLALALHIRAGVVDQVNEVESHFPDVEVTECVQKAFVGAAIPAADGELAIVYPLRLGHAPDGRDPRH